METTDVEPLIILVSCFSFVQVRYASLTEAVRLLGCFSTEVDIQLAIVGLKVSGNTAFTELFHDIYNVLDGCVDTYLVFKLNLHLLVTKIPSA